LSIGFEGNFRNTYICIDRCFLKVYDNGVLYIPIYQRIKILENLSDIQFPIKMTVRERAMLKRLGKKVVNAEGDERGESNTIRQALKLLMKEEDVPNPENLFADRRAGNRLPKSSDLIAINTQVA
jgi:hypothetical protein